MRAAEQRVVGAAWQLGAMASEGRGGLADNEAALHWYQLAAQHDGNAALEHLLAWYDVFKAARLKPGRNQPITDVQAVRHLRLAAEHGLPNAQNNLAVMLYNGWGVKQDIAGAKRLFSQAATAGNRTAKAWLDWLAQE